MKKVNFEISDSTKKFLFAVALTFCVAGVYAQDTSAGTAALTQVTTDIQKYIPIVQKLVYAIAGVVAVIGAVSVYIKMNNEEQDVKKSNNDDYWCLYFPCGCRYCSTCILWLIMMDNQDILYIKACRDSCLYGSSRSIYRMGSDRGWMQLYNICCFICNI